MKRSLHAFKLKIMILRKEERKQRLGMIHKQNESLSKTNENFEDIENIFENFSSFIGLYFIYVSVPVPGWNG